jgi:hypothetical protein
MTAKTFLTISSVVAIVYGIGFLLFPGPSIAFYGPPPDSHQILIMRYFASTLLAFGVFTWFVKDLRDWEGSRAALIAITVLNALGLLVTLLGMIEGLFNSMAWTSMILYAAFFAGALYYLSAGGRKLA